MKKYLKSLATKKKGEYSQTEYTYFDSFLRMNAKAYVLDIKYLFEGWEIGLESQHRILDRSVWTWKGEAMFEAELQWIFRARNPNFNNDHRFSFNKRSWFGRYAGHSYFKVKSKIGGLESKLNQITEFNQIYQAPYAPDFTIYGYMDEDSYLIITSFQTVNDHEKFVETYLIALEKLCKILNQTI